MPMPTLALPRRRPLLLCPPLRQRHQQQPACRRFLSWAPRFHPPSSPPRRPLSTTRASRRDFDPNDPRILNARPLVNVGRVIRSPRTHTIVVLAVAGALIFYFSNIEVVPVSGRRRFNCFSDETVRELAELQFRHTLAEIEAQGGRFLPDWDGRTLMVRRVMRRLIPVSGMDGDDWEVRVIDDPSRRALALPKPPPPLTGFFLLQTPPTPSSSPAARSSSLAHIRHGPQRRSPRGRAGPRDRPQPGPAPVRAPLPSHRRQHPARQCPGALGLSSRALCRHHVGPAVRAPHGPPPRERGRLYRPHDDGRGLLRPPRGRRFLGPHGEGRRTAARPSG